MSTLGGIAHYYENRETYRHYMHDGVVYTTLDTATVRNILTTVFVVLNLSIGFVGSYFLRVRNLHKLSKSKGEGKVPINHLTPWMSELPDFIKYTWDTFRLPGGFFGVLMFLTASIGLAHQYFVNSFVLPKSMPDLCTFEQGIVTTMMGVGKPLLPSSTFATAGVAYDAQLQVYVNGGEFGIYKKVNTTSTNFLPTTDDILGSWDCFFAAESTMARDDWQSSDAVNSFIQSQNFLYTEAFATTGSFSVPDAAANGFLAWSADQPDESTITWNVRASVANGLLGSRALVGATATVTNLQCSLSVKNGTNWIPPTMPSDQSLKEWAPRTFGALMNYFAPEDFEFYIEWMLNGMVMVAGSGNTIQSSAMLPSDSLQYGCKVDGTKIMPEIWAILGAILLIIVPLLFTVIYVPLQHYLQDKFSDKHNARLVELAPSSVQAFQLALLKEMSKETEITTREIRDYVCKREAPRSERLILTKDTGRQTAVSDHDAV